MATVFGTKTTRKSSLRVPCGEGACLPGLPRRRPGPGASGMRRLEARRLEWKWLTTLPTGQGEGYSGVLKPRSEPVFEWNLNFCLPEAMEIGLRVLRLDVSRNSQAQSPLGSDRPQPLRPCPWRGPASEHVHAPGHDTIPGAHWAEPPCRNSFIFHFLQRFLNSTRYVQLWWGKLYLCPLRRWLCQTCSTPCEKCCN